MGIRAYWDDDTTRSVLRIDFEGAWGWRDFHELTQQVQVMAAQTATVILLVDTTHSRSIGTDAAAYLYNWIDLWPKNVGYTVVVSNQPMITAVTTLLGRMNPRCRRTLVVNTLAAAQRTIAERGADPE